MTAQDAQWPRIKEIVAGALDLPADERAAYVVSSCGADSVLRAARKFRDAGGERLLGLA